jgi:hypothetical protein
MKKIYSYPVNFACVLLLMLATSFSPVFSQTSVQIGMGTNVNTGTLASVYAPICRLSASSTNDFSRGNILYTAAELTTAGIANGTAITKIGFFKVGNGASVAGFPFKIYMRNSATNPPLSTGTTWANIISTHTLVYGRSGQQISDATGWVEFTLDFPFVYTGQSLEMAFDSDMSGISGSPATGPFDWQYTTGFADNIIGTLSTSEAGVATLSGTTTNYKNRPNILITYNGTCAGSPVAGDAVKNISSAVCPGTNIELNLVNHVPAPGITYTWQSSPTMGGTYTDVSSASNSSAFSISPVASAFYKAAVTCGGTTTYSTPVEVVVIPAMNGVYTIDPLLPSSATNFQSFADVLNILKCGIAGPVVCNVSGSAVFNELIVIDSIPGTSPTNTVTFNGNGATLTYANSLTGERAVVKLNGADYTTLNGFIINPTGTTYGYGVQLLNGADSNTIRNCTINASTSSTGSGHAGIVILSAASSTPTTSGANECDGNVIMNNTIDGGYASIAINANGLTSQVNNNKVIGNVLTNFYNYGIHINGNNGAIIDSNDLSRPTRTSVTVFYGIYFTAESQNCLVTRNRVHNTFDGNTSSTSSNLGIYFTNCDASMGNENIVSNNIIYNFTGTGIHYGLYNGSSDYVKFLHNTVDLGNQTPSGTTAPTRAFFQTTLATGIVLKNNILKVTREGTSERWAVYFGTIGSGIESNNNVLHVGGAAGSYIGYVNSASQLLLSDWVTASSQDANSKSDDPLFTDPSSGNFTPTAPAINDIGSPVGVTIDILGNPRSIAAPDPGAYEFSGNACTSPPTPGNVIFAAIMPVCQGAEVSLNLENNSFGEGQTYKWLSSATLNGTYIDISTPSASTGLIINPTSTMFYKAAVTCSGNTQLTQPVEIVVQPPFAGGVYTINSSAATGGSNFQSFGDAVSAISCGITSSITFNVVPGTGPYNEQVIIPNVPGVSEVNTITFNGNGNTLGFLATETAQRATLKLDGTDYVTINNLVVQAYGMAANEYGFGIQLTNGADHNTIRGCTVEATQTPVTAASTNFAGIVLSGSPTSAVGTASASDHNTIDSNIVIGGYYGITLMGAGNEFVVGNSITRNTVSDFYQYGIYINSTDSTLVERNDISRPMRSSVGSFYGIYFTTGGTNTMVSKNKIHNGFDGATSSTSGSFGIYLTSVDATASNPNIVVNNLIYGIRNNGPITGLYHTGSDYVKYYHNTISMDDASSTVTSSYSTTGILLFSDDAGVEFKNNIISLTRGGNSLNRGINMTATTPVNFVSNNNVLYINTLSSTNVTGIVGSTNYNTLADWKTANGGVYDQNSKDNNPLFTDILSDDYTPTEQAINGIGANIGIATDIKDVARIIPAPDPGAIEFGNNPCTSPPTAGTSTVDVTTPVCPGTIINLNLVGNSTGVNQTYQWLFSTNLAGPYSPVGAAQFTPDLQTTSLNETGYFRAAVTCNAVTDSSTPVMVEIPLPFSGTYTINSTMPTSGSNFQTFADAYNAMKCGIGGPVVFNVVAGTGPYNEQLIIPFISGMSATNTIRFNGNGEVMTFAGTTTNERAMIKLDGAKYVTIDSLVLAPTATTNSYGVQMLNDADHNTVMNCTITIPGGSTSSSLAGIVINSSHTGTAIAVGNSMCDNNLLANNIISGGYSGISILGDATTYRVYGNKAVNNTITDFYTYGINLAGNVNAVIEGNDISRPFRSASITSFYGINLNDSCSNTLISKNKIHDPFAAIPSSTSAAYGIRLLNADADAGMYNTLVNNIIYNFANAGTQNGILNNGADNVKYYHNSISLDDVSASCTTCGTRGIYYQISTTTGVDIRNNVITITRGGTGDRQALYFTQTSVAGLTINNNLYYLQSAATINAVANVGGASGGTGGTNYPLLADWQTTGKDANGLFTDPLYANAALGDLKPTAGAADNKGTFVGVTTDITNAIRSALTPDVGAFEFGSAAITQYVFIGNGNWNVAANWLNQAIPPFNLPAGSEIIINPAGDGECVLNLEQSLLPGSALTVVPGKKFRVNGNLQVNN